MSSGVSRRMLRDLIARIELGGGSKLEGWSYRAAFSDEGKWSPMDH